MRALDNRGGIALRTPLALRFAAVVGVSAAHPR